MRHFWISRALLVTAIAVPALVAACGGGQSNTEVPPNGSGSASASAAPTDTGSASAMPSASTTATATVAWKDMDHQARLAFMKNTVMPKMHDEFAAANPKEWGDINCGTCHGDGAKAGTFKMPNAKLPVLPGSPAGFEKLAKAHPDAMKFMKEKVVPDMAALLGKTPYDPVAKTGDFGCAECHTFQK